MNTSRKFEYEFETYAGRVAYTIEISAVGLANPPTMEAIVAVRARHNGEWSILTSEVDKVWVELYGRPSAVRFCPDRNLELRAETLSAAFKAADEPIRKAVEAVEEVLAARRAVWNS